MGNSTLSETDVCDRFITPAMQHAGWNPDQIRREYAFTDGQVRVRGHMASRGEKKRAEFSRMALEVARTINNIHRLHDPHEPAADLQHLRHLHQTVDEQVCLAYSWPDLASTVPPYGAGHAEHAATLAWQAQVLERLWGLNGG